ncbi:hypothetical protein [Ectopseudomonas composti]|jgi:hypothetical protein|uniref:hypothetical protein n=1 Tax=Ectopseudomonas composti TaxID=658457 RepID=UPI000773DC1F|nr:hypothetical protein [Pseudomonas composti]
MKYTKLFAPILLAGLVSGCASVAVSDNVLSQRTSLALGLTPDQFTISNRVDGGVRTDYNVKTRDGKNYACYVTGSVSVLGPVVSDALCNTMGGNDQPAQPVSNSCNALLKAAGRC